MRTVDKIKVHSLNFDNGKIYLDIDVKIKETGKWESTTFDLVMLPMEGS